MPEITKCSMHEPNCSTARHWQSPRQPQWAGWRDLPLHRATGCSLLPSKLMLPSGRSRPGPGPWDSPEGQSSPRREAVHSHPQGTRTLPGEPLPAQRTSGIGSGVGLVPAPCSCSCRHSVSYLAPHPRLLAPQPLARHRATGGLCLKGNSIMVVLSASLCFSLPVKRHQLLPHGKLGGHRFWGTLYTSSSLPRKNSPCVASITMTSASLHLLSGSNSLSQEKQGPRFPCWPGLIYSCNHDKEHSY